MPLAALLDTTQGEDFALAAITAAELFIGIERADSPQRRLGREQVVGSLLAALPVLPFDLPTARVHARLWATLLAAGQIIGPYDLLIAATALAGGHSLLTDNLREFRRVPGLDVQQPRW